MRFALKSIFFLTFWFANESDDLQNSQDQAFDMSIIVFALVLISNSKNSFEPRTSCNWARANIVNNVYGVQFKNAEHDYYLILVGMISSNLNIVFSLSLHKYLFKSPTISMECVDVSPNKRKFSLCFISIC